MKNVGEMTRSELLTNVQGEGRRLEGDHANPHRNISLFENQLDEASLGQVKGDPTLDQMAALARTEYRGESKKASLWGLGSLAGVGLMMFGFFTGAGAIPIVAGIVTMLVTSKISKKHAAKAAQSAQLFDTTQHWKAALAAQNSQNIQELIEPASGDFIKPQGIVPGRAA